MMSFIKPPYCKVCHDAGKPEKEYTSHYVRSLPDRNGKTIVTCPILLSTTCNHCGEIGHTTKFCHNRKNNIKNYKRDEYNTIHKKQDDIKTPINKPSTIYNVLMESDEEEVITRITRKPVAVNDIISKPINGNVVSWATIASKPAPAEKIKSPIIVKRKPFVKPEYVPPQKTWVEWTDSDDDYVNEEEKEDQTFW